MRRDTPTASVIKPVVDGTVVIMGGNGYSGLISNGTGDSATAYPVGKWSVVLSQFRQLVP